MVVNRQQQGQQRRKPVSWPPKHRQTVALAFVLLACCLLPLHTLHPALMLALKAEGENRATEQQQKQMSKDCPRLPSRFVSPSNTTASPPHDLRNINLVLIGDSVTRFQYLELVHYLHTGYHLDVDDSEQPLLRHVHNGYPIMCARAEAYFQGAHRCNCYRNNENLPGSFENRYWADPCRNNSLTYIGKFGVNPMQGHWMPQDLPWVRTTKDGDPAGSTAKVFKNKNYTNATFVGSLNDSQASSTPFAWSYQDWSTAAITDYLAHLKPSHIIFNAGLWRPVGMDASKLTQFAQAIRDAGITPIFKTATAAYRGACPSALDKVGCQVTPCLDLSYTKAFYRSQNRSAYYYDNLHVSPGLNVRFNEELLALLKKIEEKEDDNNNEHEQT